MANLRKLSLKSERMTCRNGSSETLSTNEDEYIMELLKMLLLITIQFSVLNFSLQCNPIFPVDNYDKA